MKILLAHNYYQYPGGEESVLAMENATLREQGHQVLQYTVHNDALDAMSPLKAGATAFWNAETYRAVCQLIDREKPDILHVHNTWPLLSPSVYYAAWNRGVPVVQTLHNYRLFCPSSTHFYRDGQICEACLGKKLPIPGILHTCYRESLPQTLVLASTLALHHWRKTWHQRVDTFIALTEFSRSKCIQGGLPSHKIVVKSNALYPDPGKRSDNAGEHALFVGRISQEKGIQTLLKAWRQLKEVPLKIVGDGPLAEQTRSLIKLEQMSNIEFLGRKNHEQVLQMMKKARFLIFPSELYETFGMTIIESFACGTPVIAASLGSLGEIISNGHTGLLFTPGDVKDLAAKVRWAWGNPKMMAEMGQNARGEYEEKYTAQKNYEQLIAVYQMTMSSYKE